MSDLDDEIRSHLEHEIDDNVARGMTRGEAEAAAYRKFGNQTRVKEDVWRLRPWAWLDGLRQDLRYALRMMRKNRGFTAIAVASLALGIGGNTALFSLVDRAMLRTLPVREPERLVQLSATRRFTKESHPFFTYPNYEDLRTVEFFESVAGWNTRYVELEWNGKKRNRIVTLVTGDYFPMLAVRPVIGRLLDNKDDSPAGGDAAVISYALWEREFQLSPAVLGQRFRWGQGLFTVVGVTPREFQGVEIGRRPGIFLSTHSLPQMGDKGRLKDAGPNNLLALMARLKPGVTREQIQSILAERWPKMAQSRLAPLPDDFTSRFTLTPGYAGFSRLRSQFGYGLWILLGLSGVVLAAACANLASLQLLRADARRREMSIRAAAGATSGRIVRQWFTESLLLSAVGGLAGWIAAHWITNGLLLFLPQDQRAFYQFGFDGRVLVVSLAATVATALIFGALPGWRAAREADRKEAGRGSVAMRSGRWVKGATALQLAASLVLILGAGLFGRSLQNLVTADYGYNREGLATVGLGLSIAGYTPDAGHFQRHKALLDQVRTLPQVQAAALAWVTLPGTGPYDALRVPGYVPSPGEATTVWLNGVTPGYFALMGIPILAGRDFDEHDRPGAVAIVSESLARHFFRRVDATGEIIAWGAGGREERRIVGVAGNTPVRDTTRDLVYFPNPHGAWTSVMVRPQPGVTVPALLAALGTLAKRPEIKQELRVEDYATIFGSMIQQDRMLAVLGAAFGGLGAGLALIGLYGTMAYTVSRRTAEMGVRMALGGSPSQIAQMVLRETCALAALGLLFGVPVGALASRLVAARLYQVRPFDPLAIAAVALVMLVVSVLAAFLPAWRAARVDPAEALRAE